MSAARLCLRPDLAGQWHWLTQDSQGRILAGPAVLAEGDALPRAAETVVIWPEPGIVIRSVPLPRRGLSKWRAGLPYLVEDWVADEVQELHVVAPESPSGAHTSVAVVRRALLTKLLQELAARGIDPDRVLPEASLLAEAGVQAAVEGPRASMSLNDGSGGHGDADMLEWLLASQAEPLRVVVEGEALPTLPAHVEVGQVSSLFAWLVRRPINARLPDLRQGAFASQRRARSQAPLAKAASWAALAAGLAWLCWMALDVWQLGRERDALQAQLEQSFRAAFGAEARMVDPAFQLASERERLSGGADAGQGILDLLGEIAPLVTSEGPDTILLTSMDYRDGVLELALRARDVGAFDGFRERLGTRPGLSVELGSTQYGSDGFSGRLRVRRQE